MSSRIHILVLLVLISVIVSCPTPSAAAYTLDDLGGDDINLLESWHLYRLTIDIASNGDIYAGVQYVQDSGFMGINVYRSQDHGTTWDLWGELTTPAGQSDHFSEPCLQVVEGIVAKCYVAYTNSSNLFVPRIMMVSSDLADTEADFSSPVTVMSSATDLYAHPRFDTDVDSYSYFYIYLVASRGTVGSDIVFARSVDQGASFEASYVIGNLLPIDRDYTNPDISYGFGGYVNVAWEFSSNDEGFDSAIRFTRAENSATGGFAAWNGVRALGSTSDDIMDLQPRIESSAAGSNVVIAYKRRSAVKDASALPDPGVFISTDNGLTFPGSTTIPDGVIYVGDIVEQPGTGNWFIGGTVSGKTGIHRSNVADLTSWTPLETLVDQEYQNHESILPAMALNPAQGNRVGMLWSFFDYSLDDAMYFDGEWRRDDGYPNLEPGFPLDLDFEPVSPPAVVDINGDGQEEIVFGDTGGNIQIIRNDGTALPGWPVNIGEALSESPIAVGDLRGNGELNIVAGARSGLIYCYDAQGEMMEGNWPYTWGSDNPAYVAIGAFGLGPYPRGIVASIGYSAFFLDHTGYTFPGGTSLVLTRLGTHAPAIGDVDGDGLPEAVLAHEEVIVAVRMYSPDLVFWKYMPVLISGSPTLGDFDLDGDMEVVVPLEDGHLHVLDGDGTEYPGFPFLSYTAGPLSTAAIGQMLGTYEPEIVTAARYGAVHVLYYNGVEGSGYPVYTGGWNNYGSPIMGRIDGTSSDVVLGSRGQQAWAWANLGAVIDGWPKASASNFYEAPAMGDIDLDGSNEVVLLSTTQLLVVDVNNIPNEPIRTWAMAGHDPQRTGCSDCAEDVVTPVAEDSDAITRVSFALPSPNPSSGSATFRFAVPGPAVVNLEIFDVRGHRVSLVTREEVGMGNHVVSWGGLSDKGSPLASGIYFARLRVQGPGITEEITRKITLAR